MKSNFGVILCVVILSACSQDAAGVLVVNEQPAAVASITKAKSEQVFYNGKTYGVDLNPAADGNTSLTISGMNGTQAKDAAGLATSSFHHFACRDTQKAVVATPIFDGALWRASAHCA